jgi:O-antigen ligase
MDESMVAARKIDSASRPAISPAWISAALLGSALILGGGGSPDPLPELIVQLIAVLAVIVWLAGSDDWRRAPRSAWLIAALVAVVPLLQLVPLPPVLWQSLPGRELQRDALALVGLEQTWQSWSLAPSRTLASLLSLGPPLAVLVMTAALDTAGRLRLVAVICLVVLLSLIVGALQLSGGSSSPFWFYGPPDQVLLGFQANRNSTADVMLVGLVAVPTLIVGLAQRDRFPLSRGAMIGASAVGMALCLLGIVLTASRAGLALAPLAFLASLIVLGTWLRFPLWRLGGGVLLGALAIAFAVWLLWNNAAIARLAGRLSLEGELRPEFWRDSLYAARLYFPFGVGMGDFVPTILASERLEIVIGTIPNRAHNDFLELAVEAGAFGLAALGLIVAILFSAARETWRSAAGGGRALAIFAIAVLILLGLHSLVDYPYRSLSLACLGAACAGMVLAPRGPSVRHV